MTWEQKLAQAEQEKLALIDEGRATLDAGNPLPDDYQAKIDACDQRMADARKAIDQRAALEQSAKAATAVVANSGRKVGTVPVVKKEAYEDDPQRGFKTPRDFLMASMQASLTGSVDDRLKPLRVATAGSDEAGTYSDSYGGFLIPTAFMPNLLKLQAEGDPTASLTRRIPMTSSAVNIPSRVDKDHSSSVSGGFRVYRRAETQTVSSSRAQMELIELRANELFGVAYATEEILQDSPLSFVALIESGFREEFPAKIIDEKINGTGVGQYLGVLNAGCTVSVAKESGQTAATINGTNIVKMRKRCWNFSQAVWLANHDTIDQLYTCAVGNTGDARYLFRFEEGQDLQPTLMGRPVIFTEYCKTLGTVGDLVLGVWGEYLEGIMQTTQMAESMHVRFLEHERAFKFYARNAGAPWWRTALTPKNSSSTLSPFVTLATRA